MVQKNVIFDEADRKTPKRKQLSTEQGGMLMCPQAGARGKCSRGEKRTGKGAGMGAQFGALDR